MTRQYFIDIAKGITIICVVFFHASTTIDPALYYHDYLIIPVKLLHSFIMPFFFMISAVFLRKRLEKNDFSNRKFLEQITTSLLVPFYTLSIFFLIINISAPQSFKLPSFLDMIRAVLYMPSRGDMMPSGVLWFLFVLYALNLITFIFLRILKVNIFFLLTVAVLLKLLFLYIPDEIHFFATSKIARYYVFFLAGYLLSEKIYNTGIVSKNFSVLYYLTAWLLTSYVVINFKMNIVYTLIAISGLTGICGSLFVLGLSFRIHNSLPSVNLTTFFQYCGRHSILIYVFHTPTFFISRKIISYLNFSYSLWGLLFTVLTGILLPLLYGKLLSYHTPTYRILLGRNP